MAQPLHAIDDMQLAHRDGSRVQLFLDRLARASVARVARNDLDRDSTGDAPEPMSSWQRYHIDSFKRL
jgi:hypothetical protein